MNYDLLSLIEQMEENVPLPWVYYALVERDTTCPQLSPKIKLSYKINNSFAATTYIHGEELSPVYVERHNYMFTHNPIPVERLNRCIGLREVLGWLLGRGLRVSSEKQIEKVLNDHYFDFFSKASLSDLGMKTPGSKSNYKPYADSTIKRMMGNDFKADGLGPFCKIEFYEPFKGYRKEPSYFFHFLWSKRIIVVGAVSGTVDIR